MFRPFAYALLATLPFIAQPAAASPGIYSYVGPRAYDTAECMRRARAVVANNPAMKVVTDTVSVLLQATTADVSYNIRCDIPGRILLITAGTDDLVARMNLLRQVFEETR